MRGDEAPVIGYLDRTPLLATEPATEVRHVARDPIAWLAREPQTCMSSRSQAGSQFPGPAAP